MNILCALSDNHIIMMYNQLILFVQNNTHFMGALLGLIILAIIVSLIFTRWCTYCHPRHYVTGVEGKSVGSKPQRPPPPYPVVVDTTRVWPFFGGPFGPNFRFSTTVVWVVLYMSIKPKSHFSHKGVKSKFCLCCIVYHILIILNRVLLRDRWSIIPKTTLWLFRCTIIVFFAGLGRTFGVI